MPAETVVEVPPDTFLPITTKRLTAGLGALLKSNEEANLWEEFVDNLRAVVALHYDFVMNEVREVLEEYEGNNPPRGVEATRYFSSLTENLKTLFDASQYTTLTETTFTTAQDVEYEFDFPTSIDWSQFDPEFLRDLPLPSESSEESTPEWENLRNHMIVFTRGVRQTSKTGFFFPQKVELLLTVLQEKFMKKGGGYSSLGSSQASPDQVTPTKAAKKVVRRSLRDVYEQSGFFKMLFKKVEIKEPMFDKVCVVYKNKGMLKGIVKTHNAAKKIATALRLRKKSTPGNEAPVPMEPAPPTQDHSKSSSSVEIALFREVPFGDLEAIFPHKVISLKKVDTVVFVVKIVSAVVILGLTVRNLFFRPAEGERAKGTLLLMFLFMVAVVKQVVGIVMGWMNMRKGYERDVANWAQVRTEAMGMPVVAQLVDDVKEQELKEMMLAYFFLWQSGEKECTAAEIDSDVENFLFQRFSYRIDFDEDDGMQKLLHLGLVTAPAPDTYTLHHTPRSWIESHPHHALTSTSIRTMPQPLRRLSHSAHLHPLFTSD
eukprot:TRINITY_DN47264_c0_g1_i1.p1 TRINITY_DN47264_c0_g1~~TRINITY_DN47264_c0_g1_i1.p1  ORF type:complete len:556 (+),score=180.87 TRINITY_DN47264_c0_g1_i1:39-1670(+)